MGTSTLDFPKFNSEVNPNNEPIYVPLHGKVPIQKKVKGLTFQEIVAIARQDEHLVIGMLVPKGHLVIDIDDIHEARMVFRILRDKKEPVLVIATQRGIHIHCKNSYDKKTVGNLLACGAYADTIPHVNGNTFAILPFKMRGNKSAILDGRKVVYYNGIGEMPYYLTPVYTKVVKDEKHIQIPITGMRNDILNRHLWRLKTCSLTNTQRHDTIRLMNQYMTTEPLSDEELDTTVLRDGNNDDLVQKSFFDAKGYFKHEKLGEYMIKSCNIRRDARSRQLYYYDEDDNIYRHNNDYLLGIMTRLVPSLKDFQKQETLKFIEQYLYRDRVRFNEEEFNVVFNNGLLNVRTLDFKPMGPQYLETIKLDVDYNPRAHHNVAVEFFNTATGGCKATQQLLFEAIGYSMIKTNGLERNFILTGEGRNGKSTFLSLIKRILGPHNTTNVSLKDIAEKFRTSELENKLASLAGDISNQAIPDTDLLKSMTSGEEILFEKKYQQAYSGISFATMFFACNQLPRTPDTSAGFYRRWMIIPFNANLDKVSTVEGMFFKKNLECKESLEMIAYQAVQAIHKLLNTTMTFTEPPSVRAMLDSYRVDNSSVLAWANEKYRRGIHALHGERAELAYGKYNVWAEDSGYKKVRSARFREELQREFNITVDEDGKLSVPQTS